MQTVIIVIHLLIVIAMVGVVLMQRSEGGGLGIGGGSGFMSARGAANALTRTTAILAAAFFATSLALSLYARGGGILDQLGGETPSAPAGEQSAPAEQPAVPAPAEQSAPAPAEPAPEQPAEPRVPTGQ
jgi:preprotein translocase subunit SecG